MSFLRFILATNNFLSWLAVVVVLALSFSGVLNNVTLIGIAHEFPTTFTPDGLAFFFWVLIFALMGIFSLYQLLPPKRKSNFIFSYIGPFFIYDCVFMFIWLFCWHWRAFWASFVFMLGRLASLIAIYVRLRIDYSETGRERTDDEGISLTSWDYWILQVPFSISLAWTLFSAVLNIVIAVSISNINVHLELSAEVWSIGFQTFLTLLSLIFLKFRSDVFFSGVIALVQAAIAYRHFNNTSVCTAGFVNAAITGLTSIYIAAYLLITYLRSPPSYEALSN